jgi:hypothetical protein
MKQRTDLDLWMHRNRITNVELAQRLSDRMKRKVSPSTVAKWRIGATVPRPKAMIALGDESDGMLNVQSFVVAKEQQ